MSKIKKVLFIDDDGDDISTTIELLASNLQSKGYELISTVIDLGLFEFKSSEGLCFEKIKAKLSMYFDSDFDLIACDFDLKDEAINGFDILVWLNNITVGQKKRLRRSRLSLYSSQEENVGKAFRDRENSDIIKLINLKIEFFFHREHMHNEIATCFLKEGEHLNLSYFIRDCLRDYPEMKFQSIYPKFSGKSFEEIATEIDKESFHGIGFQTNIVELAIAHLVEMNQSKK